MSDFGRWIKFGEQVIHRSEYTDCIIYLGIEQLFIDSGMTSPKKFLKERAHAQWKTWQVVKRMEGE